MSLVPAGSGAPGKPSSFVLPIGTSRRPVVFVRGEEPVFPSTQRHVILSWGTLPLGSRIPPPRAPHGPDPSLSCCPSRPSRRAPASRLADLPWPQPIYSLPPRRCLH